jgi:hypothetical protein
MIHINELGAGHVGRWVEYRSCAGEIEIGKIKSWTYKAVFVVYHCNGEWHRFSEFTAEATDPRDLTFR